MKKENWLVIIAGVLVGVAALVDVVLPLFQKYAIQNFIRANKLPGFCLDSAIM